jgi:tight adherence protein B
MGRPVRTARLRALAAGPLAAGLLAAGLLVAPAPSASAARVAGGEPPGQALVVAIPHPGVPADTIGMPFEVPVVSKVAATSLSQRSLATTPTRASALDVHPQIAATSKGPLSIPWLIWVAAVSIFLALVLIVVALGSPTYVSRRRRRVESIEHYVSEKPVHQDERSAVTAISASLVGLGDKVMSTRASTPQTQLLLERADLPLRPGEWAVLRLVAIVVGVAGGVFLIHGGLLSLLIGVCLGTLAGFVLPVLFLKFMASHRAKKFEAQLPDVLTLVASSLSTGFSLLQALDAVARDADEPSAKEFSRALAETRIGLELTDSLDHLADRMDSKNMRWAAMAIDIQRQVGGNLAETLRNTAATLRDRQALSRHVKALSAEGRLSAYILIALPVGLFLYMLGVNRAYVSLLWTTGIGIAMSAAGLMALAVGVYWMNKVVKVEV